MKINQKLSIAVPTHSMKNGGIFFRRLLDSLWNQSFQKFEIVVTDNSEDNEIKNICEWYRTGIIYYRNPIKGMAQNTNEAIKRSTGELIKILYMDDFLAHDGALAEIVDTFRGDWLVSGCIHTGQKGRDQKYWYDPHFPMYNDQIQFGNNTIGSPSVLTIKNKGHLLFDEEMTWLLDCDLYKRYHDKYGKPEILKDINVVIGTGEHQMTFILGDDRKAQEQEYVNNKYNV